MKLNMESFLKAKENDMTLKQYKTTLLLGVIGAVLTLIGDLMIGANPAGGSGISTGSPMLDAFADSAMTSDLRLVLGGMLGMIGLPLEGVAYFGIGKFLLKERKGTMPILYQAAVLAQTGIAGSAHLSCAVIALLFKWISPKDTELAVEVIMRYTYNILTPMAIIFGVLLFIALLYVFILIIKGCTPYPRYAAFYNMAFGAAAGGLLGALIGNNMIGNGVSTAAVSIGQLWMFVMMLVTVKNRVSNT